MVVFTETAVKKETFNIWASCGKLQILLIYGDKKQIEALQELIWGKKVLWTEAQTSIHSTNGIKEKKGAAFQEQNIFTVICYVIKVKLRQYLLSQQDYDPQWASALKYKL